MAEYEVVYSMTDFWDRPRGGIANFRGRPHVYRSTYSDMEEDQEVKQPCSPQGLEAP